MVAGLVYGGGSNMHSRVWEMTWVLRDACASGPSSPEDARALWKAVGRRRERVRSRLGAEGRAVGEEGGYRQVRRNKQPLILLSITKFRSAKL